MAEKNLLILERSTADLEATTSEDGSVVLEGVFTELGVKNKNNRIYEEKEVLPHIKELQAKVKTKKLLGELDHPKDFDISLSNVSHVIEDLTYDEANRQVKGRIRLLNTSKGKEAKALIEDGIPLHISSRAAGTVGNDNKVKIKKWFTYDLVADPGFENAELSRVNESFGFDNDDGLFIYEIDKPIYKIEETKSEEMDGEPTYVLAEDFNKYTEHLKDQITSLKEALAKREESVDESKVAKLVEYCNKISEKVNTIVESIDELSEGQDKQKIYSNYLAKNLGFLKEYAGYMAEELDNSIRYTGHVAEKADKGILYTEKMGAKLDEAIEFGNYLAKGLDDSILYTEGIGNKVDQSIRYSNHLRESIQNQKDFSNYIVEEINKDYEDALLEKRKAERSESLTESVDATAAIKETEKKAEAYTSSLTESIDALIAKAEAKKVTDHMFLNFLGEGKKREFEALTPEVQEKMVTAMNESNVMSTVDAHKVWAATFQPEVEKLDYIKDMPEKFRGKWDALSESRKKQIMAESKFYPVDTAYQINNFWATRDLRSKQVEMEKLDESTKSPVKPEVKTPYAISDEQKNDIVNKVKFSLNR